MGNKQPKNVQNSQKIVNIWTILAVFGLFWPFLVYFGHFWSIMATFWTTVVFQLVRRPVSPAFFPF